MQILNVLTNLVAHTIEFVPKAVDILQSIADYAQKIANFLKQFGAPKA